MTTNDLLFEQKLLQLRTSCRELAVRIGLTLALKVYKPAVRELCSKFDKKFESYWREDK